MDLDVASKRKSQKTRPKVVLFMAGLAAVSCCYAILTDSRNAMKAYERIKLSK